jgi:hypothetical protein
MLLPTTLRICLLAVPSFAISSEMTLDQSLIVACTKVDVARVSQCLRDGASVSARLGDASDTLVDPWTGVHIHSAAKSWTPLLALAESSVFPDPPSETPDSILKEVRNEIAKTAAFQDMIPRADIEKRRNDMLTILWILLSHKCDVNAEDDYGATALYHAANAEKLELAKILLDNGANPNTKTGIYIDGPGDITPLHAAINSRPMIQLLLDHGANGSAKDSRGQTPADWLSLVKNRGFDLVLTRRGWQVELRPRKGND